MNRLTKIVCGVVLAASMAGAAAASAAAAPPEFGRCVEVPAKTGEYKDGRHCLQPAPGKGRFDWVPGPGEHKKLITASGPVSLETTGKTRIACQSSAGSGEYTGAKTATLMLSLTGCENLTTLQKCQTTPATAGKIESSPLEGEIGYIKAGATPVVGLDLKGTPDLFTFECGQLPESPVLYTVEGSVIAPIKPTDKMTEEFKVLYKEVKGSPGKQAVESFEGGAKDTLSSTFTNSGLEKVTEQTALSASMSIGNEEAIEIRLL